MADAEEKARTETLGDGAVADAREAASVPSSRRQFSHVARRLHLVGHLRRDLSQPCPRRSALLAVATAAVLLAVVSTLLVALGAAPSWLGFNGADLHSAVGATSPVSATPSPTRPALTPTPKPTPPPDPMIAHNLAQGCHNGTPPAPAYTVVANGHAPSWNGRMPNEVALTFDDGPTPYSTPPILSFLERTHTPATFFVEGQYAQDWPDLIQREWRDGFAIGMHTWNHPDMTHVSADQLRFQFGATLNAVHAALGPRACLWFWRPPYGALSGNVLAMARDFGLTTVIWDDDTRDWSLPGPQTIANTALAEARPGGIILMHDGPSNRAQTLAALPLILEGLRARGLKPVTLPQLLADGHYPGVTNPHPPAKVTPTPTPRLGPGGELPLGSAFRWE